VISVDTGGRLGNQMFQLAFAHAASRRLSTSFVMRGTLLPADYFELEATQPSVGPVSRRVSRLVSALAPRVIVDNDRDPAHVLDELVDWRSYSGFYQSEQYFSGYEDDVRGLFTVRAPHVTEFSEAFGGLRPYACLHLRRRDYPAVWALPTNYFADGVAAAGCGELPLMVVTDDLEAARAELHGLHPEIRFESNSPIIDLQLIMNAAVVIASNSSFSWWGAWLNRNPALRVVAPANWLGFRRGVEEPHSVIPKGWIQVPVAHAA
jgi:hypothetical protein